jgi:DNA-binding MarR family transcriptional regulator
MALGRTQQTVLHLLASVGACSASELERHWPSLTYSSALSAVNRLAGRGLVDLGPGEFVRGRFVRSYVLTPLGVQAEQTLLPLDEDDAGMELEGLT